MNAALAATTYGCEGVDGCRGGVTDTVTILVNDEGYTGLGGPLSASGAIRVDVL